MAEVGLVVEDLPALQPKVNGLPTGHLRLSVTLTAVPLQSTTR